VLAARCRGRLLDVEANVEVPNPRCSWASAYSSRGGRGASRAALDRGRGRAAVERRFCWSPWSRGRTAELELLERLQTSSSSRRTGTTRQRQRLGFWGQQP
jgi:hypothetical protein